MEIQNNMVKRFFKNDFTKNSISFGLFMIIAIGFYLRWESLDVVRVVDFFTRDVERAFNIAEWNYMPLAGPELNSGGRLPGPFMYILLALPLLIHPSYESIFIFNFILNIGSIPFLFFVLKKHFGPGFSALTTIFFALSLHHIQAVISPINPSFIFPFAVLYIGALFNFTETKHPKYLLGILLTILLGIQFHFSILTYVATPIFLIILFRIKISKKTILAGLIILIICFLPFLIHKTRDYVPKQVGIPIERKIDTSFVGLIKIVTVQNTIHRIARSFPFEKWKASKLLEGWFHIGFSVVFYGLIFLIANKIKKQGINNCVKEVIIIFSFYFPALIYEILNPWTLHYWYQNIFILPEALIFSLFIFLVCQSASGFLKNSLIFCVVVFIAFLQIFSFQITKEEISFLSKKLFIHTNASGSYKNSKILLNTLMERLDLNPEEFFNGVYFLDFYSSGYRRLIYAYNKKSDSINLTKSSKNKSCYFIMSSDFKHANRITFQSRLDRYKIFKKDKTLKIIKVHKISFKDKGFPVVFQAFEYITNQTQSCYSNAFNPFVVTKNIRDLLIQSKSLSKKINYGRPYGVAKKIISLEEKYNTNNELEFFKGEYVIQNGLTMSPFKLRVSINRMGSTYSLRGEIESYYFFGSPSFNMGSLDLIINSHEPEKGAYLANRKRLVASRYNKNNSFNILSSGTLASAKFMNLMTNNGLWNYNRDWFREVDLPKNLKFKKNRFYLDVFWKINWNDNQICCYSVLPQKNLLNLKKPKK
jgi:hypothetical protein